MKVLPIRPLAAPVPPADPRWRLGRLLSAPHRLGFFAAAVLLAASAVWWALALAARQAGVLLPWAVPPPVAHGLLMSQGFMPLFITGFLFTAGPRWLGLPDVPARTLRVPVALMAGGWVVAMAGFHGAALLAALGVASAGLGWGLLVGRFVQLLRASPVPDTLHATLVAVSGAVGVLALAGAAIGLGSGRIDLVRVATQVGLWGFLAPTFAVVSHRMIPFFTASALPALESAPRRRCRRPPRGMRNLGAARRFLMSWRPNALLWVMVAVLWLQGGFAVAELLAWPLPAWAHWAQVAFEAPAAVLLLWLAWRWGLVQSLKIRLLAMLHAGFLWLGISVALAAVSHGLTGASSACGLRDSPFGRPCGLMATSGDVQSLGLAPLHALGLGYLGATMIAMVTRVASGHSGRPLAADNLAWGLYWGVQTAAVLRVAAALWPAGQVVLTLAAAAAWALAVLAWAGRYGGWLGRPRADGRPG